MTARRFQPTLPARGATAKPPNWRACMQYFNPRSPHGERRVFLRRAPQLLYFNPRSPHGERQKHNDLVARGLIFQPTLPARGATPSADAVWRTVVPFQPTLPARGATSSRRLPLPLPCHNFNPRSPHGERRGECAEAQMDSTISTHAPRTGSDEIIDALTSY